MIARATVSPPTPESKIPIGRWSMPGRYRSGHPITGNYPHPLAEDGEAGATMLPRRHCDRRRGSRSGSGPELAAEAGLGGIEVGAVRSGQVFPAAVGDQHHEVAVVEA